MEEEEEFRRSVHLGRMEAVMVARYTRQTRNTSSSSPADCLYLTGKDRVKELAQWTDDLLVGRFGIKFICFVWVAPYSGSSVHGWRPWWRRPGGWGGW